jgi:hypothetical protein
VELWSGMARKATIYRKMCVNIAPLVNVAPCQSAP